MSVLNIYLIAAIVTGFCFITSSILPSLNARKQRLLFAISVFVLIVSRIAMLHSSDYSTVKLLTVEIGEWMAFGVIFGFVFYGWEKVTRLKIKTK